MFAKAPLGAPRHMAGTKRAERPIEPQGPGRASRAAHLLEPGNPQELVEVPAPVRVHRSRLAFAISVTVASLPILILDNFPATADTGERSTVSAAGVAAEVFERPTITVELEEQWGPVDAGLAADATTSTVAAAEAVPPMADAAADLPDAADDGTGAEEADAAASDHEAPRESQPAEATHRAPAPTPAPTTTAAPAPASEQSSYGDPNDPATWDRLAQCESHGRWDLNSGNGYYGGLQFSLATWRDVGGAGYPHEASREEQIKRGQILQARYGWGQWPHCSSELGYR